MNRIIHNTDAIAWLESQAPLDGCSIITSLPDISEFSGRTLANWKTWFTNTAALVLSRCPDDGITIFFQSDIKKDGVWIDKGYLCQKAAEQTGHELIAHKIVCRAPAGTVSFGRPVYSHLLCFSKNIRPDVSKASMDVLPLSGATTWTRGMGAEACRLACRFIMTHTSTRTIVDPFCGHGTVLAIANELGLTAIGVELSRKRAKIAEKLTHQSLAEI